jgi:hypothetical protein
LVERWAWRATAAMALVLAAGFAGAPLWVPLIREPEMPTLSVDLLAGPWLAIAAGLYGLAGAWLLLAAERDGASRLLGLQLPVVAFVPLVLLPVWRLGDQLRGLPVRQMAASVLQHRQASEPLAMVGVMKPSLHYYSRRVVLYEGATPGGLLNLNDRLAKETRRGLVPSPLGPKATVLVVIDRATASAGPWQQVPHKLLASAGLYRLWRVDRQGLDQVAQRLSQDLAPSGQGQPDWQKPRPERY